MGLHVGSAILCTGRARRRGRRARAGGPVSAAPREPRMQTTGWAGTVRCLAWALLGVLDVALVGAESYSARCWRGVDSIGSLTFPELAAERTQ